MTMKTARKLTAAIRVVAKRIAKHGMRGLICAAVVGMMGGRAQADNGTWSVSTAAATHNWTDTNMWASGTIAAGTDFTANFTGINITGAKTVALNGTDRTIGNITFTDTTTASHDLTISGNILTLDRTDATPPQIDVLSRTLTISSQISGTVGLQKISAGTLVLSRDNTTANTYSGTTTLTAGILQGNTGTSVSLTPGNPFGTSALQLNGGTLQLRSSGTANATADTIQWNNNTTVGGNVTINVTRAGGTGSNKIHLLGTLSIGAFTLTASDVSNENHDLRIGATTLTGNAVFNVVNATGAMNLTLGAVGDGGMGYSLTKNGAATLTLSGASTYSGGTTVSAGVILVGNNSAFGLGAITVTESSSIGAAYGAFSQVANPLQVNATKTLTIPGSSQYYGITFTGVVSGSGTISVVGGNDANTRETFGMTNAGNTFTGDFSLSGGSAIINVNSLGDAGKITLGANNVTGGFQLGTGTATSLLFNTRQIVLAGSSALYNNNATASTTFTVNTDLAFSGTGVRTLTLGGSNTGANTFDGIIGNNGANAVSLTKADAGRWILGNAANSYTGPTTVSGGTLQVSTLADGSSNSNIGASGSGAGSLILNGGTLKYTGGAQNTDRLFSLQVSSSLDASGTGAVNFTNIGSMGFNGGTAAKTLTLTGSNTGDNTLAAVIGNNTGLTSISKTGIGTWVLSGANSNTGATTISGGGKLILDYGTQDNNKIAGVLNLGGGEITLRGGSYVEAVSSLTITSGSHTSITRDGDTATAKIAFGVIARAQSSGGTMSLAEDGLATTTTPVVNGILGGGITVGSNWAKVDGSGNIIALTAGDYTALPTGATTSTVNYQLTGSQTRAAGASVNSLRISGDGSDQVLTITSGDLKPSLVGIGALGNSGGILYAGDGNNNYTITGAGNVAAQNNNQELIINTFQGTLTLDMAVVLNGAVLTKTGAGTLVLTKAGTYTFGTYVHQGALRLRHANAAGAGGFTVANNAALELANSVAIPARTLTITGAGVSDGGALRNVASNTSSYAGAITLGAGGARINSDASGALTLSGGVATSLFNDVTFGGAGNTTVSTAAISGAGGLVKDGAGTTTLSFANTYSGATTISAGTLKLGADNVLPSTAVTIGAGTLDADTRIDTVGTLDVTGAAVINLGSAAALTFADCKSVDWNGGTLNITGTLGATSLRFGTDNTGLTSGQLAVISVNGIGTGKYFLNDSGFLTSQPAGTLISFF